MMFKLTQAACPNKEQMTCSSLRQSRIRNMISTCTLGILYLVRNYNPNGGARDWGDLPKSLQKLKESIQDKFNVEVMHGGTSWLS